MKVACNSAALALVLTTITASAYDVPNLTRKNYVELTDGKTVLIKFFIPNCKYCKDLKPTWKQLAEEWDGNEVGLVAEIDCSDESKALCDAEGIRAYPTIKYGDPTNLQDYRGNRAFNALNEFAKENLKPLCSPTNIALCNEEKRQQIQEFQAMSSPEMDAKIAEYEKQMKDVEEHFENEVLNLQATYERLSAEKNAKVAHVKAAGLILAKSVKVSRSTELTNDDPVDSDRDAENNTVDGSECSACET